MTLDSTRIRQLREILLSPQVQVGAPLEAEDVPAYLSQDEVAEVFKRHVPGVEHFLFRQQYGQYSLQFMQTAYKDGLRAFQGTELHDHLMRLMRLVVHYGHEGKPGASGYLAEVAEAFMDCQAVQARAIERVGLMIRGVSSDFRGLVVSLIGEYKTWALKMLAAERLAQGFASDDLNPTHYENRLTADLGNQLGLNVMDVRRAELDVHANARFCRLGQTEADDAAARCRELFDMDALVSTFVDEVNSFCVNSPTDSLPHLFLNWASEHLTDKYSIFDEDTCMHVELSKSLALAIFEALFLGQTAAPATELHRGVPICELFDQPMSQDIALSEQVNADHETGDVDLECGDAMVPYAVAAERALTLKGQDQSSDKITQLLLAFSTNSNVLFPQVPMNQLACHIENTWSPNADC